MGHGFNKIGNCIVFIIFIILYECITSPIQKFCLLGRFSCSLIPGEIEGVRLGFGRTFLRILQLVLPIVSLGECHRVLLTGEVEQDVGNRVCRAGPAHQVVLPSLLVIELNFPSEVNEYQHLNAIKTTELSCV